MSITLTMDEATMKMNLTWRELGTVERELILNVSGRLLMGQKAYGELTPHKKHWSKEAKEELLDAIVYVAADLQDMEDGER